MREPNSKARNTKEKEMLKGISPLLNADVLHVLRAMGHGDDLIIADTIETGRWLSPSGGHIDTSSSVVILRKPSNSYTSASP